MNLKFAFAALVGLFIVIGLVVHQGVAQVAEPLGQAGSRLGLVCLLPLPPLVCSALAWQVLLGYSWQNSTWTFMGVRGIREAATLLPRPRLGANWWARACLRFTGAGRAWRALMGHPVTFAQAFIVFSLGHAVRSTAFVIPSRFRCAGGWLYGGGYDV